MVKYPMGALHMQFRWRLIFNTSSSNFNVDHLDCSNNETDISDCKIEGWKSNSYCIASDALHVNCTNDIEGDANGKHPSQDFIKSYRVRNCRGRVSNFDQSEARKQCFLATDWSKFETLPR